jgi:hypothetical protein
MLKLLFMGPNEAICSCYKNGCSSISRLRRQNWARLPMTDFYRGGGYPARTQRKYNAKTQRIEKGLPKKSLYTWATLREALCGLA